jgi:VCBS repeat-containing protein
MSDLQNLTPANTYKALLQLDAGYTNGISGSTGANALQVSDGAGNNTSLALSTNRVGIGNTSPSAELDVSGDVIADEYALDQTGASSSAVAIHAPATNELAIRTNTAERVRIDSSGNVGIGTTSPTQKLTLAETSNGDDVLLHFQARNTSATDLNSYIIYDPDADFLALSANQVLTGIGIDVNGKVGIGTNSPSAQVEIHTTGNSADDGLIVKSKNGGQRTIRMWVDGANNKAHIGGADGTQDLIINYAGGNVGIGTTSPSAPLEVSSTTGGVIMPRMTTTQMNAISSPTDGEMIYNTTANKFYGYANGAWVALH